MAKKSTSTTKTKTVKEKSIKTQALESIANAQVQAAMGITPENRIANLQKEYDDWSRKKTLQDEYNAWAKQNVKTSTSKSKSTIPSLKFMTAEERKQYKEDTMIKDPIGEIDSEKSYKNTYGDKRMDTLRERQGRKKEIAARNEARQIERERKENKQPEKKKQEITSLPELPKKSYMDMYTEQTLGNKPAQKQTKEPKYDLEGLLNVPEKKDAGMLEMSQYQPKQEEQTVDTRTTEEKLSDWLNPEYKLSDEEKAEARQIAQAELAKYDKINGLPDLSNPEERENYSNMVNLLNKTSKFANTMQGFINPYYNLAKYAADGLNSLRQKISPNEEAQANYEAAENAFRLANQNAEAQDPINYNVGKFAGNLSEYALTNPLFDALGAAAGVGKAGQFALNQVGQNAQDIVLDTLPTLNEYRSDGTLTDEEKKDLLKGVGINAAGNLIMGGVGLGIDALRAKKAATIPGVEDIDNVVRNATEQAENAAQNIDNIAKQIPSVEFPKPEISKADIPDISAEKALYDEIEDLNKEMSTAWETPAKNAAEEVETIAKTQPSKLDLPDDVSEQIASDLLEIRDSSEAMRIAAEATGNPKAIEKYNKLADAIEDYEKALYYSEDLSEVNTAKKATDAARQALYREIKKTDPNYKGDLTGTKIGQAEYRRTLPGLRKQESEELANSFIEAENALDNNKYVRDAFPDTKIKDNVPGANKLQFFADKKPTVEDQLKQLRRREQEAMLDANEELRQSVRNGRDPQGRMLTDIDESRELNRLGSERAYREGVLENLKSADEREDEALDALTDYVNRQRQTPPPNNTPPVRNTQPTSGNNVPPTSTSNNPPTPPIGSVGPEDQWKISKWRTNTAENTGWLNDENDLPIKDYAYRVFSEAEQKAAAAERYADSTNVVRDLINTDQFDEVDVKAAMGELNRLLDEGTEDSLREARRLGTKIAHEGREGGRTVQAFAEYNRDSAAGALSDANRVQEELIDNWKSRNVKKKEGNSRIAKALADMGNKWKANKVAPELTHDQIKKGVIAEIEREVGSVETHFNDNDIEFLTQLAEDKSIPVWKITSEIEHKLKTGNWYTLDESTPIPKPTNTKLQNALNSLIDRGVRAEKEAPTLKQISEEVRNTLSKESSNFEGQFTDEDMDYIANLINNGASREELAQALDTKMATGSFGISDDTLREVNNIFKSISNYDPNSKQFVEGQAEAYRLLANEVLKDATPMEKFEAWRYIAMLGNPKTMLRNFIGNQTFGLVTGISNNIAAVAEAGTNEVAKGLKGSTNKSYDYLVKTVGGNADIFSKLNADAIQRTKAILNPISDSSLIKAAAEDADASRYRQIIGSKYEKFSKDSLKQHKSVFNNKLLQLYEKATDAGISDYKAVKNKFSTSLAGYLKANGYDQSIFNAETELARLKKLSETQLLSNADKQTMEKLSKEVSALEKARDYALKQAEYATFHEDNAVATALTRASSFLRNSDSKVLNAGGAMLEGVVPFKKTPANVLRSGLEYSPLGAIDSLKKTGKLIYENTGKRAGNFADTYINSKGKEVAKTFANDVIDSWSKTLTGSGLTALGFYLYDKGALLDSDKETKYQDQLEGLQNYSIKLNDKTYTLDWAAPSVMPLLLGAEIAKVWNASGNEVENWYDHLDEYLNAANRIADPIVETSMLSGIKDTLETAANAAKYDENLNIPTLLAYNTLTGYATQAIPTASGQIARTIDNTRRSTYTDKEGVAGTLEKQGRKLMNKIPGLSQLNQPYIDTYGREQTNSPFNNPAGNLAYQMFSPGYLANVNTTDADKISREVYEASGGDENVLAKWKSYVKMNEKRVSPEDYTNYARVYGQTQYDVRNALANDEWFNSLDDTAKTDIINDINTMADHVGKASLDPEYSTTSKPYVAYSEGGIEGLLDYYKEQHNKDVAKGLLGDSGVQMNSNAAKAVVAAVSEGNMEEAEKLANQAAADKAAGKSTTSSSSYDTGDYGVAGVRKSTTTEAIYAKSGLNGLKQYKSFQDDFGSNASDAYKRYENAKTVIPGLSAATYRSNYKRIDSYGDSNGSITQKELLSYLNDGDYSESEALDLWAAYGNAWAKTVVYQNGQWVAKKQK